jgi:hypothetical protein
VTGSFSSAAFIGGHCCSPSWVRSHASGCPRSCSAQGTRAPRRSVEAMLRLSRLGPDDFLVELGAGVGAVTFPAARERAARVLAVEIEPLRVAVLRLRRRLGPAADRIEIRRENMYSVDLGQATVVSAFLWPGAMARLRAKFEQELRPGVRIVSRCHQIPGWTPIDYDAEANVLPYEWPRSAIEPVNERDPTRAPSPVGGILERPVAA